jgi:hypothetical protein
MRSAGSSRRFPAQCREVITMPRMHSKNPQPGSLLRPLRFRRGIRLCPARSSAVLIGSVPMQPSNVSNHGARASKSRRVATVLAQEQAAPRSRSSRTWRSQIATSRQVRRGVPNASVGLRLAAKSTTLCVFISRRSGRGPSRFGLELARAIGSNFFGDWPIVVIAAIAGDSVARSRERLLGSRSSEPREPRDQPVASHASPRPRKGIVPHP